MLSFARREVRLLLLLLLLLVLLMAGGCGPEDLLDGTWRQPRDSPGEGELSFELVLGQYGSDVAGLVRQYEAQHLGSQLDFYRRERHCSQIADGSFSSKVLRLWSKDPDGTMREFWLKLQDDERLVGETLLEEEGSCALVFERISEAMDRECPEVPELMVLGTCTASILPAQRPRAALVYIGFEGSNPCLAVGQESSALEQGHFSLVISRKPSSCLLVRQLDQVTLAWGVFVVFDDQNNNSRWDRDPLPGGDEEPLIGVARDHALLYLDGDASRLELQPEDLLEDFSAQSFSLVEVVELEEHVTEIRRVHAEDILNTRITVQPVGEADLRPAPRLKLVQAP